MSSYQDYINALKSGIYNQKIKIELLRTDETPRENITSLISNTNGNLSVKRTNGIRRSCNFDIINLDNIYIPNTETFFIRQKFKLYLGLELPDGTDYFLPQGIYIIEDPSVTSNFSESYINIQASDKFSLLSSIGGELSYTYIINIGTDISTAIQAVLTLGGDPKRPIIDASLVGLKTVYTMTYEAGSKLGDILIDLAQIYSCSCFYNENGQLVISKDIDDESKSSLWDFNTSEFSYMGGTNQFKWSELFTSVRVVGSNISGATVSYKATNTNLLSPTSVSNLGFDRTFYYSKDTISTLQQATDLANYILKRKVTVQNSVQISSIAMFHLNPDELITITDEKLGLNEERFLIDGFSLSLSTGGTLSINCVKSKEIPFI